MQGERLVVATKDQVLLGSRLLEYFPPANALLELLDAGGAVLATHENMHAGALTYALAPTPRVLVTGGAGAWLWGFGGWEWGVVFHTDHTGGISYFLLSS